MAGDWDVSKPIDHTLVGSVPGEIRDVLSSAKQVLSKEHVAPSTSSSGGQHVKGAARIYLNSAATGVDPEGNALATSDTSDNGRLQCLTGASNALQVYVGTSAGVSTGFQNIACRRVYLADTMNANSKPIVGLPVGTVSGNPIHVGQINTTYFLIKEPATGAVIDPVVTAFQQAGEVLQVVNTQTGAVDTGTTQMPLDDTIPQNTEGDEYMTLAITPKSATNKLKIEIVVHVMRNNTGTICGALFQDSTASAIAAGWSDTHDALYATRIVFTHYMTAGTVLETTFKFRAGPSGAATVTFNGNNGSRIFGGVMASSITITEIKV